MRGKTIPKWITKDSIACFAAYQPAAGGQIFAQDVQSECGKEWSQWSWSRVDPILPYFAQGRSDRSADCGKHVDFYFLPGFRTIPCHSPAIPLESPGQEMEGTELLP